jgi:hypothetical protein
MANVGMARTREFDVFKMLLGACWVVADTSRKLITTEFEIGINLVAIGHRP